MSIRAAKARRPPSVPPSTSACDAGSTPGCTTASRRSTTCSTVTSSWSSPRRSRCARHPPRCGATRAEPRAHTPLTHARSSARRLLQGGRRRQRQVWRGVVRDLCAAASRQGPTEAQAAPPAAGRLCRLPHRGRFGRRPHILVHAPVRIRRRAHRHASPPRCLCVDYARHVVGVFVQVVRRVLPKTAQDGGAGRRAQGAVLPAVPARVPKDHVVERHAATGRRFAGGALDVCTNQTRRNAGPICYGVAICNARRSGSAAWWPRLR